MDDPDTPSSPRKKLKAHHSPHQLAASDVPMSDCSSAALPAPAADPAQSSKRDDKEAQCGILEYASPDIPGFTGILKKRYTDFLVNEILPNGQVIHLDNLKKPSKQAQLSQIAPVASQPRGSEPLQSHVSSKIGASASLDRSARPIFESTNLNKFEESSRKREKVFMRRDLNGLSIVDEITNEETQNGNKIAKAEEHEVTGSHTKASMVASSTAQETVIPDHDEARTEEPNGNPEPAEQDESSKSQIRAVGTVEGWQTYAGSDSIGPDAKVLDPQIKIQCKRYSKFFIS